MSDLPTPPRSDEPTEAGPPHELPGEEDNSNSSTQTGNHEAFGARRTDLTWSQDPTPFGLPPRPISPPQEPFSPTPHPRVSSLIEDQRTNEAPTHRHHFRSSSPAHPYNYLQNAGSEDAAMMPLNLLDHNPIGSLETYWQYEAGLSRTHDAAQQAQQQNLRASASPRTPLRQVFDFFPAEDLEGLYRLASSPPWHAVIDAPVRSSWSAEERQGWIDQHLIDYQLQIDQGVALVDRTFIIYNPLDGTPDDDPFLALIAVNGQEECGICQQVFATGELAARLPCGHCFHRDCIVRWFVEYDENTCPLCRQAFDLRRMPNLQVVVDPSEI